MIKKFKKAICIISAAAMMLSLSSCGSKMEGRDDVTTEVTTQATTDAATTEEDTTEEVTEDTTEKTDFTEEELKVQQNFELFCQDYFNEQVTSDYLSFHFMIKDGNNYGIEEPEPGLGDSTMTLDGVAKEKKEDQRKVAILKNIDREALTAEQKFDYDVILDNFETEMAIYNNIFLYEPFSPMHGLQANISTYFTDFTFREKKDVENYIATMKCVPDYFQGYLDFEKLKAENGYFMSDASVDDVIEQCDDYLSNRDDHFLITVFNNNIDALSFLTDEEKAEFKEQNKEAVKNYLLPAFENIKKTLSELKGSSKYTGGICNYEGGKEYYKYLLKHYAGTEKTPEQTLSMLEGEMDSLMSSLYGCYFADAEGYNYFAENFDNLFAATDSMTPTEMIDKLMDTATAEYPAFNKIPFRAEYLDKSLENIQDGILAYYLSPCLDEPDNNLIRVNGLHTDGLWTTLAHEGYPGHMFQNSYYMSTNPRDVRTLFNFLGYMEGWAMYSCYDAVSAYDFNGSEHAETLAKLYQINDEMSYLLMGIVDIQINYNGWTVDQVAEYLNKSGFDGSAAEELYNTLSGDPGLYQSYVTGYYEMKELRDYAEKKLGSKFDAVEFNKTILEAGPCQYKFLKQKVNKYIQENN